MTFAVDQLPHFEQALAVSSPRGRSHGIAVVWRLELMKCARLIRVRAVLLACLLVPFLVALAITLQSTLPADTLFGQWLHDSGFALPMVILGFAGQWVLPLLTALVSGDIFAAEDNFGTWKTILTRSRSRADLFAGKALAAITYTIVALGLLALSSLLAGVLMGAHPVVGLSGQQVFPAQATRLVAISWAVQLPPLLGFCALAVLLSILTRSSPVGMGAPVVIGLLLQLSALINLPLAVRDWFPTTAFAGWHGLWVQHPFYRPIWVGLGTSAVWFFGCIALSWLVFRRRNAAVS